MIVGERLAERMKEAGLTQAALARLVGVKQPTITRLISGTQYGSTQLHKIARALRTTPAYLTGETDNPDSHSPDSPELDHDELELIACYRVLGTTTRAALMQVARSMAANRSGLEPMAGAGR